MTNSDIHQKIFWGIVKEKPVEMKSLLANEGVNVNV